MRKTTAGQVQRQARVVPAALAALRLCLLLCPLVCPLAGCGTGADAGSSSGEVLQFVLKSVPAEDGVVYSDRGVRTDGVLPTVGDLDANQRGLGSRQFFSFDVTSIPEEVLVTSATLRLDLYVTSGTPFNTLGNVVVDYLDYGALDADDYNVRALQEGLGPIASSANLGPRTLDVKSQVAQVLALDRPRAQFRLRFSFDDSDFDFSNDYASFAESEAAVSGNGQEPTLIVVLKRR